MPLILHNLRTASGSRRRSKRVGRGNASGRGTYSGKGQKGQRARSGGRKRLIQRGVKHFIMRMPKQRGFKRQATRLAVISLRQLMNWPANNLVNAAALRSKGLIKVPLVKIIGGGKLSQSLKVQVHGISQGARKAIEAAGGTVELVPQNPQS